MNGKLFISKYEEQIYFLLRVIIGFLFIWHGVQKLYTFPQAGITMPLYITLIAGPVELIGGFLVVIGFWSRWAAFICSGEMAFAYWIAYGTNLSLPSMDGGELAMIYCFVFLFISARGSGKFSIDNLLEKKRRLAKR